VDWFVKAFLKASLAWLATGVTLGVAMALRPPWAVYRPVHLHMLVLGFVAMMIFGVAYHVVPRFAGHQLHSRRAAGWHWGVANVGLALMALGFALRVHDVRVATALLGGGGVLAASGAYVFAWIIWRTIDGPKERRAPKRATAGSARASTGAPLPVIEPSAPRRSVDASLR
jgi:cbb3-type cytochrome oxidase subunit 1